MRIGYVLAALWSATAAAQDCPAPIVLPTQYTGLGISFIHDNARNLHDIDRQWLTLSAAGKEGLISMDGKQMVEPIYEASAYIWQDDLLLVQKAGKWGFIDREGKEIIAPQFSLAEDFKQGLALVALSGDTLNQIINKEGKLLLDSHQADKLIHISEGMIAAEKNDKIGFMDLQGKWLIEPQYTHAYPFKQGLAIVMRGKSDWGVINQQGQEILPLQYAHIARSRDGYFFVYTPEGKQGLFNAKGEIILPMEYDLIAYYDGEVEEMNVLNNDAIIAVKNNRWGLLDAQGKEILPFEYDFLEMTETGNLIAAVNHRYGVINRQGEILVPYEYERLDYVEGIYVALQRLPDEDSMKNNATVLYSGIINAKGETLIPTRYDWITPTDKAERYIAANANRYILLDAAGKALSEEAWNYMVENKEGMLEVVKNNRWGYLDKNGNILITPQYDAISTLAQGRALVAKGKRQQLLDIRTGCVLIDMAGHWKK